MAFARGEQYLGQGQADEIKAKVQGGSIWMAMAMMVSTRLWLGGVISRRRDSKLVRAQIAQIRMTPTTIIEALDVQKDVGLGLSPGSIMTMIRPFSFKGAKEAFHGALSRQLATRLMLTRQR